MGVATMGVSSDALGPKGGPRGPQQPGVRRGGSARPSITKTPIAPKGFEKTFYFAGLAGARPVPPPGMPLKP
jgi:hypothetical protein